jgi:hypothetical protein
MANSRLCASLALALMARTKGSRRRQELPRFSGRLKTDARQIRARGQEFTNLVRVRSRLIDRSGQGAQGLLESSPIRQAKTPGNIS